jgi:hypothetical protein
MTLLGNVPWIISAKNEPAKIRYANITASRTTAILDSSMRQSAGISDAIRSARAPIVREGLTPRARGMIAPSAT